MPIPKELEQRAAKVARALVQPIEGDPMPKEPLKVIAGAPDRPLIIGDVEIQCYVLEDETRVLSQRSFLQAIGRSVSRPGGTGGEQPPAFLAPTNLKPFISNDLTAASKRIEFRPPTGRTAYGYQAILLPRVCKVYRAAHTAGVLRPHQMHIAKRAEDLLDGFAEVGIIALVDEATGYQQVRSERALATILEKFIAKELQPLTKTFPYEFYAEIFRLRKWPGPEGAKRPKVIGHWTNDFVYQRMAPGLLEELRHLNPPSPGGNRPHRHTQWFTPDLGHPKLKEHLAGVIAVMRLSQNWNAFKRNMDVAFPSFRESMQFPLDDPTTE